MSDENVYQFPPENKPPELLIGPITYNQVVVEGRSIPKLTGHIEGSDYTCLVVDRRFSISVPNAVAHDVAWLVANALAVGAGYSHLGAETKDQAFAPQVMNLNGDF